MTLKPADSATDGVTTTTVSPPSQRAGSSSRPLSKRKLSDRPPSPDDALCELPGYGFGWQYLVAMCTLSIVICYADRSNISTAILPMADQFGWDKGYQGLVLSSFFIGYATTQILGGTLADRWGSKFVLATGVLLWSLFTFLTPAAAAAGGAWLIAARIALGLGEGVAFPAIHSLISASVPRERHTTAVGLVTTASYVGTALAFGVAPMIITHAGWPSVFHIFASLAVLWLPPWLLITPQCDQRPRLPPPAAATAISTVAAADAIDPALHDPLLIAGLEASARSEAALVCGGDDGRSTHDSGGASLGLWGSGEAAEVGGSIGVGLWPLIKRKEVWAICAAQYGQSWGMYGLLTWLPTFFHDTYDVDVGQLGSYTLMPYVVQGAVGLVAGVLADKLIASGYRVRHVRVGMQVLGMLGPAACLVLAVTAADGLAARASAIISVGLGLSALTLGGVSASHLDIAPRHAGAVYGAGNTAATLAGLVSVPTTGWVLQATGSWPLVFTITALHYCGGAALWALWAGSEPLSEDGVGSAERQ